MISQETIDKIKTTANLVEVIGESVALRRLGRNFIGLCPFHSEKSPSFNIRDNGESYHCFGCGKTGNALTYVMETRGLSFPEAVEDLAARYGIEVRYEGRGKRGEHKSNSEDLYRLNHIALRFFESALKEAPTKVKEYIATRKLGADALKTFRVGFAPLSWNDLADYLKSQSVDENLALTSGLLGRSNKGTIFDRFRGRVIFPIFIDGVRIAGFGGRLVPGLAEEGDKSAPKYLNSPESEIYKKSKTFFGLPQAGVAIRENGSVYLVEGYMDVIGLWQAGVKNVIATCGTSVTEEHVRRLSNIAKRVIVLFDGDNAGRAAAAKMLPISINSEIDFVAKFMDEKDDPDTLALKHGKDTEKVLQQITSLPLFDCYLNSLIETHSAGAELGIQAKGKIVREIQTVLQKLPAERSVVLSEYLNRTSAKLRIQLEDLEKFKSQAVESRSIEPQVEAAPSKTSWMRVSEIPKVEQELLKVVIGFREEVLDEVLRNSVVISGTGQTTRQFIEALRDIFEEDLKEEVRKERVRALLEECGEDWLDLWKSAFKMREDPMARLRDSLQDCYRRLQKTQIEQELKGLELELRATDDSSLKAQLGQEQLKMRRMLQTL